MGIAADRLLTVPEVAERLQLTPDGVYKLIQRGKIEAVRLSERKTRVPEAALDRYITELQSRASDYLSHFRIGTPETLRAEFVKDAGISPEEWLTAWKRNEFEDTPENMELLGRAGGILAYAARTQPAAAANQR